MKNYIKTLASAVIVTSVLSCNAFAILTLELTRNNNNAIPIAIENFTGQDGNSNLSAIIANDLKNSGRFNLKNTSSANDTLSSINYSYWRDQKTDYVVVGSITNSGGNYDVKFSLVNAFAANKAGSAPNALLTDHFTVSGDRLRSLAHHISDEIYEKIIGQKGIFSTRIAYVVVNHSAAGGNYRLEVADMDGYNPKPLLSSSEPIMSPSWSPDGKRVAYVSFENKHPQIYVQDVSSGQRRLITSFSGINGAPAWSPDGNRLAVVLSKSGSPKIYVVDVNSGGITQVTNGPSIDTEPSWSPDGQNLVFTSNRGGNAQIYKLNIASGSTNRVSFDGKYNAKANYTPDGRSIIMLHQDEQGDFDIAQLDLASGSMKLLTKSRLDESPSVAPNGSMVLYSTNAGSRVMLGMVSTDGRVKLQLPAPDGDVQSPAWSPFLS